VRPFTASRWSASVGLLLLSSARLGGFWLALAAYLLLSLGLFYAQLPLARLLGSLRTVSETGNLTVLESPYRTLGRR
jgi:hypothetical protein